MCTRDGRVSTIIMLFSINHAHACDPESAPRLRMRWRNDHQNESDKFADDICVVAAGVHRWRVQNTYVLLETLSHSNFKQFISHKTDAILKRLTSTSWNNVAWDSNECVFSVVCAASSPAVPLPFGTDLLSHRSLPRHRHHC